MVSSFLLHSFLALQFVCDRWTEDINLLLCPYGIELIIYGTTENILQWMSVLAETIL